MVEFLAKSDHSELFVEEREDHSSDVDGLNLVEAGLLPQLWFNLDSYANSALERFCLLH